MVDQWSSFCQRWSATVDSHLAGSLAEGSVPGKDPEGSGRLTCHDVSGGSLAVTRSRGSVLELLSHAPPAEKTEMPLVGLGL
ncbi:hypothetical protein Tco_0659185 [Tanacetum coccineum]